MIVKEKTLSNTTGEEVSTDNVKLSNFFYEKIMIQKACHTAFSLLVLALQLKASYLRYSYSKYIIHTEDTPLPEPVIPTIEEAAGGALEVIYVLPQQALENEALVKNMIMFSNILSLFQCYNSFIIEILTMSWLKSKLQIHKDETLYSTGQYRWLVAKCIFVLAQPYWFLYGHTF